MKNFLGILFIVLGIILGLYVGVYILFWGGILNIYDGITLGSFFTALWGIVEMGIASVVGWVIFFVCLFISKQMLDN